MAENSVEFLEDANSRDGIATPSALSSMQETFESTRPLVP